MRKKRKKSQCLKLSQKVAFNIASEASYIYNLSRQKFLNNAKNAPFWRVFENFKLGVKVLPDMSLLIGQKMMENAKIEISKWDIFADFQTI